MPEEEKENMRKRGVSEHEIAYYDADGQKEYEPLLKDPTTPEKVITDIVEWLTLVPLKILAFQHPNISKRSQLYMLDKADKKPYQKQLIESFLSNKKPLNSETWSKLRHHYNTAFRFDKSIIELLEEQSDVFTTDKLDVILNAFARSGIKSLKALAPRYLLAIFEHKNFNVSILDGEFCRDKYIFNNTDVLNAINATKNKDAISAKLYEITQDPGWLSQAAKDVFLF